MNLILGSCKSSRSGHSHRRRSHSCERGQEAVKGSRAVFGVSQAVKDNFQTRQCGQDGCIFMAINIRNGKQLVFSVCGQTVKAPFVIRSSGQATKMMVKIF